jgi:hypothetical protein
MGHGKGLLVVKTDQCTEDGEKKADFGQETEKTSDEWAASFGRQPSAQSPGRSVRSCTKLRLKTIVATNRANVNSLHNGRMNQ